jgi:hypothetical protein
MIDVRYLLVHIVQEGGEVANIPSSHLFQFRQLPLSVTD